jgi:hypothetical protein
MQWRQGCGSLDIRCISEFNSGQRDTPSIKLSLVSKECQFRPNLDLRFIINEDKGYNLYAGWYGLGIDPITKIGIEVLYTPTGRLLSIWILHPSMCTSLSLPVFHRSILLHTCGHLPMCAFLDHVLFLGSSSHRKCCHLPICEYQDHAPSP